MKSAIVESVEVFWPSDRGRRNPLANRHTKTGCSSRHNPRRSGGARRGSEHLGRLRTVLYTERTTLPDILDPHTGYPVDNGVEAVTVISSRLRNADGPTLSILARHESPDTSCFIENAVPCCYVHLPDSRDRGSGIHAEIDKDRASSEGSIRIGHTSIPDSHAMLISSPMSVPYRLRRTPVSRASAARPRMTLHLESSRGSILHFVFIA